MKPPNGCCMLVHHALALSLLVQLKQLVIRSCKIHQSLRKRRRVREMGNLILVPFQTKKHCSTSSEQMIPLFSALRMSKQGSKWYLGERIPLFFFLF